MMGKITQRRDDLRQAWSWRGPQGRTWGVVEKRGWWTLTPRLWHSLSPHSVCKKSPNLLAALLPLPELSLTQCQRCVWPCAGKGRFPGGIRPRKECIKPCETCFANTLNLNDKGPSLKWVCFPKSYSPLANWPWLRISPQSSLLSIVWSLLPDNDWCALPVFLCKLNPIKAHWGKGSWPFSFERLATFPPQADHVLVDLFSSMVAGRGGPCKWSPPHSSGQCRKFYGEKWYRYPKEEQWQHFSGRHILYSWNHMVFQKNL